MRKKFLRIGSLSAMLAVMLGAFASHGLEGHLTPEQIDTFQIGVRYQFYHTFVILIIGVLLYFRKTKLMVTAGWLFVAGIVLFSGSLYLLAVREWLNLPVSWLGPITPIGGVFFILGWILFMVSTFQDNELYRHKDNNKAI